MDLALVSVMADTAAAFGVIGSLVFVGFQVRQNSSGLKNAAVQSLMSTYQELWSEIISSDELMALTKQGMRDPAQLDETALMRFYGFSSKFLRVYQGMHWQWKRDVIDDGLFKSMTTFLEDMAIYPGWKHVWDVRRHQYDDEFRNFMDEIFAEEKGVPLWPELNPVDG
jgi:hypothetical protein